MSPQRRRGRRGKQTESLQKQLLGVALATGLILLAAAVAMQFTPEMDWGPGDFLLAGVLIFGAGAIAMMGCRQVRSTGHRVGVAIAVAFCLGLVWAELAVGLFN